MVLADGLNGNWTKLKNVNKIYFGRFYLDENKTFMGGIWEGISRFPYQNLQTDLGYGISLISNYIGRADRVDYLGGATFITNENDSRRNPEGDANGVSLGNFININLPGEIPSNVSFEQFVLSTPLYMHEYGHTFQSERYGISYLFAIGIPSMFSAKSDDHHTKSYERQANRWARRYLEQHNIHWHLDESRYPN